MTFFSDFLPSLALLFGAVCFLFPGSPSYASENAPADYELSLSFVPEEGRLIGTAKISIVPGRSLSLSFGTLEVTGTLLKDANGTEHELLPPSDALILPAAEKARTLYISFTRSFNGDFQNLISPEGISLTSNWYPVPEEPMLFQVTASLPEGFTAIVESDSFPFERSGNTVKAHFSKPQTSIHFIAGPYVLDKMQVRENLFVYSLFFKEDKALAVDYLRAAVNYLNRYEKEIGPYPYNHYVIVANRLPTGYGMPTFTLLGQMVLRLPFIKDTSLGHEIVHSWFGNSVDVDYSEGNWCEGLTAYLADHAYREEKGEGVLDRKETITKYLSYVHETTLIPLAGFASASHNQPMAEARRAVGYNRGALLFHELKQKIGRERFRLGLRTFYTKNTGKKSGWNDLRKSFESVSGKNLKSFFTERLQATDLPQLDVENISIDYENSNPILSFTLLQNSEKPYSLIVPIEVKTATTTFTVNKEISKQSSRITIPLEQLPLEFTVDPEHDFIRQLAPEELPAVWSQFMGSEDKLVILSKQSDREMYQPLLEALGKNTHPVTTAAAVTNKELSEHDLLFLGPDQPPARSLFGLVSHPQEGLTLDVRPNPLNRKHIAALISSASHQQTAAVARRLRHFGKYSYLEFNDGRNVKKRIQQTSSGLHYVLDELPPGGATSSISSFEKIMKNLENSQVVYVGETHTSFPDHLLQLRIIEKLHQNNPKLGIGMEMFPASSQPALDRYILGDEDVDEKTFLKESDYFNVWRYDYRFFRDILRFAKKNKIPVIGLNLDRQIVSEVFRSGGTDSLEQEVRDSLPIDRDLDMVGYGERLSMMHNVHVKGNLGSGGASGFIQAQAIWDETMAENITTFLKKNSGYRMVVLAGAQHTRKDSGIPPRVSRRIAVQQASVLNIYNNSSPANLESIADYYFLASPTEVPESPKIGIVLATKTENDQSSLTVSQLSPHGKAGDAGLLVGDVLREVNGFPVSDMADLRISMLNTKIGDTIAIKLIRNDDGKEIEKLFTVELSVPPKVPMHP